MGQNGIARRLDALEGIAERCRIRELRDALGDEIVRRSREHGVTIPPGELDAKIDRALAIWETATTLVASGRTLEEAARHMALQHDLNPDRVVEIWKDLRSRGAHDPGDVGSRRRDGG